VKVRDYARGSVELSRHAQTLGTGSRGRNEKGNSMIRDGLPRLNYTSLLIEAVECEPATLQLSHLIARAGLGGEVDRASVKLGCYRRT